MKYTQTQTKVLAHIKEHGEIAVCQLQDQFSRNAQACNKLVKLGILNVRQAKGWVFTNYYSLAA